MASDMRIGREMKERIANEVYSGRLRVILDRNTMTPYTADEVDAMLELLRRGLEA